jgi:hypothetical protein
MNVAVYALLLPSILEALKTRESRKKVAVLTRLADLAVLAKVKDQ